MGYQSVEKIDERIEAIEVQLRTDTMTLKQEKDLLKEISELKKNRPKITQVTRMQSNLQNMETGKSTQEQIANINAEINVYRDAKKSVQDTFSALMESRKEQMGDLSAVIDEKQKIQNEIQEQIKLRNKARDDFRAKEKEYNAYLNEQSITFCKGLIQDKDEVVKEEKKEIEHKLDAGMMVLAKKEDRDEEYYFAPTKKKNKSKVK